MCARHHNVLAVDGSGVPYRVRWRDRRRLRRSNAVREAYMEMSRLVANAVLAAAADAVVATDRHGIISVWNPGAERIFGHRAAEVVGHSLDIIIPERLRARHWEGFHRVIAAGQSHYG